MISLRKEIDYHRAKKDSVSDRTEGTHPLNEFIYWSSGKGTYHINGVTYSYGPGCIANIPKGILHGIQREEDCRCFLLLYEVLGTDLPVPVGVFKLTSSQQEYIKNIESELSENKLYKTTSITHNLSLLFISIARSIHSGSPEAAKIAHSVAHIENNLKGTIKLEDLAKMCNYSVRSYLRIFKNIIGSTPYEFILKSRLYLACKLLLDTEMSITQVSAECGFYDAAHFSRLFKKHLGMSPTQYRTNSVFFDPR